MNQREKLELMFDRFVARTDRFALQWYSQDRGTGYYPVRSGTCSHIPPCERKATCTDLTLTPLRVTDLKAHVKGTKTLGVYQLDEDNSVKWICFDLDIDKGEDMYPIVQEMTTTLAKTLNNVLGRGSYLVEDTGSRGYHVWVFFSDYVPATKAAGFARWIGSQVTEADGTHIEVFPKQVTTNGSGNLVKLPLGIHKKTKRRCLFVDGTFAPLEDQWEALAHVTTLSEDDLDLLLMEHSIREVVPTTYSDSTNKSFVCFSRMMHEGLVEGTRDAGVYRLSLYLKGSGFPQEAAHAVIGMVNNKSNPPLPDATVETKIDSAYETNYSRFPCSDRLIDSYCSSSCIWWKSKVEKNWSEKRGDPVGKISRD